MRLASVWLLAILFIAAGVNHFWVPNFYIRIVPPILPIPETLVTLSGIIEIVLGLLILPKSTRQFAGHGLCILLVAVFPANLYMVIAHEKFQDMSLTLLWIRLPLQIFLFLWCRNVAKFG